MMPRWLLVAMLYADGQTKREIALQLGISRYTVVDYVKEALHWLIGNGYQRENGAWVGWGTKIELREALIADGHLS